jgi:glycosyltransferase involved in cell wall biosynthesis
MKVAFINIYQEIINRGAEVSLRYLAEYLASKHEVYFFQAGSPKKNKKYCQLKVKCPFSVNCNKPKTFLGKIGERLYLSPNDLKILFFSLKAFPLLLKERYDVLVPTNGFWQVLICKLVRFLTKTKIVVIGWAGIGFHDQDNLRLKPDIFIAQTKYAQKWVKKISQKTKIVYLPNSVDCHFYHPSKKRLLKKQIPIILTVAALTEYKRIDLVIKAVAKMKQRCFLLIVGQGELEKELERLAKRLLGKNFVIKQFAADLMPRVYASCQVFTLASGFQDAFPRVLLEALACGRNIVASDDFIKREVIDKAGLFVDPKNVGLYAKVLEKALNLNSQKLARKRAREFDINKIGFLFEKTLLSLKRKT